MAAKPRNVKSKPELTTADAHERVKDFLAEGKMTELLTAAGEARHGAPNHLLILMIYRHGLRVSEAVALRRKHVNIRDGRLWVSRLKGSLSTEHRVGGEELRALKRYLASRDDKLPWLFTSERGAPFTRHAVNYLIAAAGERAGLGHVHPHMLRHSCGYALADKGVDFRVLQDYLGHRDPAMTARYTRVSSRRFEGLWD